MQYTRLYADSDGESHFEDVDIAFTTRAYAPPAPPVQVSSFTPTTQCAFIRIPVGYSSEPHPSPTRQMGFVLAGECEMTASDSEVRRFTPGSIMLVEDTAGKGHTYRVVGNSEVLTAAVHLPG